MPHIPVHPSAEKRHRQSLKRAERNRVVRTRARTLAKTAAETIATSTDQAKAQEALKQATKVLYKAISSGTMHRNTVRRKVARLSASLHRKFNKKAEDVSRARVVLVGRGHEIEDQSGERFFTPLYCAVLESRVHRARAPISAFETQQPVAPRPFDRACSQAA